MRILAIVFFVTACGGGGGSNNGTDAAKSADAKIFMDAPPNVSQMITIGGTAIDNSGATSSAPIANATVKLLKFSDDSVLGMATTGADGKYSFTVQTNGQVVDAYLTATAPTYQAAATFPAAPFQADTANADAQMVTMSNYNGLAFYVGQQPHMGFAVVEILDSNNAAVAGAVASSTPAGMYHYLMNNIPSGTDATDSSGTAFYSNLSPTGMVTISATKSGAVFKSHPIKALPDTFTSTVITE